MANKPLKSIQFPNLSDTYTIPQVTTDLTQANKAAEAKKVGDELDELKSAIAGGGLTDDVKEALMTVLHMAYYNGDATGALDDLYDALYNTTWEVTNTLSHCTTSNNVQSVLKGAAYYAVIDASAGYKLEGATVSITMGGVDITATAYNNGEISIAAVTGALVISVSAVQEEIVSISADYTQSGTVYDTDSLDSLKADLVVTATVEDDSTFVVPSTDYTLSGTLAAGTSTITVEFAEFTTTFSVTVTENVLFSTTNQTVSRSTIGVDSGVKLLATDQDFTVCFDGTQTGSTGSYNVRILMCNDSSSNWKGIYFGKSSSATKYLAQWMDSASYKTLIDATLTNNRIRIILTHAAGSGKATYYYKVDNGTMSTLEITSSFIASNNNFRFGGTLDATDYSWIGTISNAKILPRVVDADYISSYMA